MKKLLIFLTIYILALVPAFGADANLTASLVTCWPGPEVYELCGHEAIRIHGTDADGTPVDSVWNYGVFDFAAPNFLYRFVKGETDYMLAGYPFSWFITDYAMRGSKVVEQLLNLTPEEVSALRVRLQKEALPENRTYRYNYIRNNCATKIADRLDESVGEPIIYSGPTTYGSFRDAMRYCHRNYPWYQFGIDLVLGPELDEVYTPREEMFLPMEMMTHADGAHLANGRPLVKQTRILYPGEGDRTLPPTPWYLTPLAVSILTLLISVGVAIWEYRNSKISRWWMSIFYSIAGIAGCVITFLVFISTHEATSPNLMILWLNPLQLLVPCLIWSRKTRPVLTVLMWLNAIVVCLLMIAWPFQSQSANIAVFPLMVSDLILAVTYSVVMHNGIRTAVYDKNITKSVNPNKRGKRAKKKKK